MQPAIARGLSEDFGLRDEDDYIETNVYIHGKVRDGFRTQACAAAVHDDSLLQQRRMGLWIIA